jgi:HAD superfamily hydrolase (TIGR01459 family)
MTLPVVPLIHGLSEIADTYDALLLDQWGVLHGGVEPYPGVLETLAALRSAGKPVAILSNAPRRAQHAEGRLHKLGVPRDAYDRLVTSGDAAHAALAARDDPAHAALGPAYLFIGPGWDSGLVEGLSYRRVEEVADADFLLAVGLFDEADPIDRYDPLFAAGVARDLVMVCVNPDIVIHRQGGVTAPCAAGGCCTTASPTRRSSAAPRRRWTRATARASWWSATALRPTSRAPSRPATTTCS